MHEVTPIQTGDIVRCQWKNPILADIDPFKHNFVDATGIIVDIEKNVKSGPFMHPKLATVLFTDGRCSTVNPDYLQVLVKKIRTIVPFHT
jgi:hypothetical protein